MIWRVPFVSKPVISYGLNQHLCNDISIDFKVCPSARLRKVQQIFKKTHEIQTRWSKDVAQRYERHPTSWNHWSNTYNIDFRWVTSLLMIYENVQRLVFQGHTLRFAQEHSLQDTLAALLPLSNGTAIDGLGVERNTSGRPLGLGSAGSASRSSLRFPFFAGALQNMHVSMCTHAYVVVYVYLYIHMTCVYDIRSVIRKAEVIQTWEGWWGLQATHL